MKVIIPERNYDLFKKALKKELNKSLCENKYNKIFDMMYNIPYPDHHTKMSSIDKTIGKNAGWENSDNIFRIINETSYLNQFD